MADKEHQSEDSRKGGQNDPTRQPKAPDPTFARQTPSMPGENKPESNSELNNPNLKK